MGCPGGMSTIRYARLVLEIGSFTVYMCISREKGDHYYIQTLHNVPFFPLQSYSRKLLKKCPERRVLLLNEYIRMCSCPPWASHDTP